MKNTLHRLIPAIEIILLVVVCFVVTALASNETAAIEEFEENCIPEVAILTEIPVLETSEEISSKDDFEFMLNILEEKTLQEQIDFLTNSKEEIHFLAESARALGLEEDSDIINSARDFWFFANDLLVEKTALYEIEVQEERDSKKLIDIGVFSLTAYCPCPSCCGTYSATHPLNINKEGYVQYTATGTIPTANRTVAVDPTVIAHGTELYIEGLGYYTAEDSGSGVLNNHIDIYYDTHEEALALPIRSARVYILK